MVSFSLCTGSTIVLVDLGPPKEHGEALPSGNYKRDRIWKQDRCSRDQGKMRPNRVLA